MPEGKKYTKKRVFYFLVQSTNSYVSFQVHSVLVSFILFLTSRYISSWANQSESWGEKYQIVILLEAQQQFLNGWFSLIPKFSV